MVLVDPSEHRRGRRLASRQEGLAFFFSFFLMGRRVGRTSDSVVNFTKKERKKLDDAGREREEPISTMSRASYDTFNGLNAVLESPRWPVDQVVLAVERCLEVNR